MWHVRTFEIVSRAARIGAVVAGSIALAAGCGASTKDSRGGNDTTKDRSATNGSGAQSDDTSSSTASFDPSSVRLRSIGEWESPVQVLAVPGSTAVAVVEQGGLIRIEDPAKRNGGDGPVVLDVSEKISTGGERGLLGVAFHPEWPEDDRLFVDYTDLDGATVIAAYHLSGTSAQARDPETLLTIEQPYENHNGGALAVVDGQLFIGMGDGGSAGDPENRAQDPDELLGKILRVGIDASGTDAPYAVPTDNPYAQGGGRPEIWATGVRNPWRFSVDPNTGLLWIGDVGQDTREEIDAIATSEPGANLGWDLREGTKPHEDAGPRGDGSFTEPVFDYGRDDGCSVTGGIVYRGQAIPSLAGRYVFGDFCSDQLWVLDAAGVGKDGSVRTPLRPVRMPGVPQPSSFGVDDAGELYVVSLQGKIFKFEQVAEP